MPYKLAITGRFRRGKDTLAGIVNRELSLRGQSVDLLAFADPLKDEFADMVYEWQGDVSSGSEPLELHEFRDWMREQRDVNGVGWQWYGEFCRRFLSEDYWITKLEALYTQLTSYTPAPSMIITDMRHLNEAAWCKEHGFFRLRISGPCRSANDVRDLDHPSERYIDALPVDLEYLNTGTISTMEKFVHDCLIPNLTAASQ